jgi:hypothetical protein
MQSFEHIPYQPSKSQLAFITFVFGTTGDTTKYAGLGVYGENGFFFSYQDNVGPAFFIYSNTDGGDESELQANWNIDTLDGSGDANNPSGLTLNYTKGQILIIDFQALYLGRTRFGFDIDGKIIYCHEFNHSNEKDYPYIQTANLPVSVGIIGTNATTNTDSMMFICSAVCSEGGRDENFGYELSQEVTGTAGSSTRTHAISLRPKTTFNSIANRISIGFIEVDILVTGSNPIKWDLSIGQSLTGDSFTSVNNTYSATEYEDGSATLSGSPAIIIDEGYVGASTQVKGALGVILTQRYPITLDAAGNNRILGQLTLCVTGIGGLSNYRASVKFKEIR